MPVQSGDNEKTEFEKRKTKKPIELQFPDIDNF